MNNVKILIPARRNSKGLPFKNRILFDHTIDIIPVELRNKVLVSTDDEVLIEKAKLMGLDVSVRPDSLAEDETSTKDVVLYHINNGDINTNDVIVMLYLTYPERTWGDVVRAYNIFNEFKVNSLLCKKEIKGTHPYLYMFDIGNNKGEQLVKHDLYRRQDYPLVFEISHYIAIFNVSYISELNNNLYDNETFFLKINDVTDVDTKVDLDGVFSKEK